MISQSEAVEKAKQWLDETGMSHTNRDVNTDLREVYVVVMPPPKDTLGGDFTVIVDAATGNVLGVMLER